MNTSARCQNSLHHSTWKYSGEKQSLNESLKYFSSVLGSSNETNNMMVRVSLPLRVFYRKEMGLEKTERQITLFWQESVGLEIPKEWNFLLYTF